MTLRRLAPALLVLAALACTPSVPTNPNTSVVTAGFDLTVSPPVIPFPNDLATSLALNPGLANPQNAQDELLAYFGRPAPEGIGGFPYDVTIPLTLPFVTENVQGPNAVVPSAPDIDPASIVYCTATNAPNGCNLLVVDATAAAGQEYPALAAPTYVKGTTSGTLTVARTPAQPWRAGTTYFFAVRGGSAGVKTTDGTPVSPSAITYNILFASPSDLTGPLAPLAFIQAAYQPVFAAVANKGFPKSEIAVVGTFTVAAGHTWVELDPGAGKAPFPSDFMLDPSTGLVSAAAVSAFGPLAAGLATLDGFSTTAMALAPTSGPVQAASIRSTTGQGVYLYRLDPTAGGAPTPVEVNDVVSFVTSGGQRAAGWYAEPPPITRDAVTGQPCVPDTQGNYAATCLSSTIGLQPAVAVPLPTPYAPLALPPLRERTEYAVVVTRDVKDAGDRALSRTTLGQMELFTNPLCTPSPACAASPSTAVSAIPSLFSGAQAAGLEAMRLALQPVAAKISADHGVARTQIAMAYTYRTQSIAAAALQLGVAPYQKAPSGADLFPPAPVIDPAHPDNPLNPRAFTPAQAATRYGVDPAILAPAVSGISSILELYVVTYDLLDPRTGAFVPSPTGGTATPIPALVALPAAPAPAGGYPLVIFHHGITRNRGDMLLIAQALAGSGTVVAAIDAAKHGARSWCSVDTTQTPPVATGCATGVACDTSVFGNQGDPATGKPGLCAGNQLAVLPVACDPTVTPGCWDGASGRAAMSGAFAISANLFRTRDTIRQDILDQSMLVRVLTTAEGQAVLGAAVGSASPVPVNPAKVWYVGQSWGSILGTADLAANPRFSRAVLNVGGGTEVDIFSTSYSFKAQIEALLASIGILPGTPEYLAFLQAAKWTLDPADPLNFAANVVTSPLPDLLADPTGATPQAPKVVLGQAARCDLTVPNATNQALYGNMGLAPLGPVTASATPTLQWYMASTAGDCPTDGTTGPGATHGFLLDFRNPSLTLKAQANAVRHLQAVPVDATPVTP